MRVSADMSGLDEAIESINREIGKIENLANVGLWDAGLQVLRSAQKRLKPSVVTGNLRASGYVRNASDFLRPDPEKFDASKSDGDPADDVGKLAVEIGFTANYAIYVHENMEGRSPKFLENAITENRDNIIKIIKRRSGGE